MAKRAPSVKNHERSRQYRVRLFGLLMILLMVASPIAYYAISSPGGNDLQYGEYTFRLEDRTGGGNVLVTEINGQAVEFQNLPIQVAYVDMDPSIVALVRNSQQIVLAMDPSLDIQDAAIIDYARLQVGLAIPKTVNAMTRESELYSLPVLNCTHASPQMPVIIFEVTNSTASISSDGACILLQGPDRDLLRLKDRLIFEYYGLLVNGEVPA